MNRLSIKPLGGVGQIGSNATLFSFKDTRFIIDCGILFPYEDVFDINYLIPDLTKVEDEIDAIIISHGHEDHIGAITHYVERFPNAKIYAPTFAKELIEAKLEYANISKKINLAKEQLELGPFKIDLIHVNHSIPNTKGIHIGIDDIDTGLLFISDFKSDALATHEEMIDLERIKLLSRQYKSRVALLDSTNIMSASPRTTSESELKTDLERFITKAPGRVFITCFSSNIHRLQTIFDIAKDNGLKVIPYGRSLINYSETAQKCEIFENHGLTTTVEQIKDRAKKRIILCSGSQGEFRGTVKRIATGNDKYFKLNETDTFIFSSKPIPGNEKKIAILNNELSESGCEIITYQNGLIHASGHPGKEDLKDVYKSYNPQLAIPIHGESLFINKHCEFLTDLGINSINLRNHDTINLGSDLQYKLKKSESIAPILIHGNRIEIQREHISERRKMASLGCVFISINNTSIKRSRDRVLVTLQGIPTIDEDIDQLKEVLFHIFNEKGTLDQRNERMRIATRRYFQNILGYRPLAIVHIC